MLSNNNDPKSVGLFYFKLMVLLLWACWFCLAGASNLFEFMHAFKILPETWLFRADNYAALTKVVNIYSTPSSILNFLFICDFTAQFLCGILFFIAFFCFWRDCASKWFFVNFAFIISIGLWSAFLVFQEIFLAFMTIPGISRTFVGLSTYEMLTLIAIHLLPHRSNKVD